MMSPVKASTNIFKPSKPNKKTRPSTIYATTSRGAACRHYTNEGQFIAPMRLWSFTHPDAV